MFHIVQIGNTPNRTAEQTPLARKLSEGGPVKIGVTTTRKCNLNCSHCYACASPSRKEHMKVGTFRRCIDNLVPLLSLPRPSYDDAPLHYDNRGRPIRHDIYFTGGEILTEPDLFVNLVRVARDGLSRAGIPVTIGAISNGLRLLDPEVVKKLLRLDGNGPILFRVNIETDFHQRYLSWPEQRKIEPQFYHAHDFKMNFDRETHSPSAAVGNAFDLSSDLLALDERCSSHLFDYHIHGDRVHALPPSNHADRSNAMALDEAGNLHACCYITWPLGNLAQKTVAEILADCMKDERQRAFFQYGPLAVARLEGKLKQALEIYFEKGVCGVCYALEAKII